MREAVLQVIKGMRENIGQWSCPRSVSIRPAETLGIRTFLGSEVWLGEPVSRTRQYARAPVQKAMIIHGRCFAAWEFVRAEVGGGA